MSNKFLLVSSLSLVLATSLISCSTSITTFNNKSSNNIQAKNTIHTFDVNKKKNGASVSVKILNPNKFNLKTSSSGTPPKTYYDVYSYQVYLIKSASAVFPLNGDPLNATNIVHTAVFNTNGNDTGSIINFTNLDGSGGQYYHIAVRAYSNTGATGSELIKDNNGSTTAWTGTTAGTPKVAVSTGTGIQVDNSTLAVSSTTSLTITPNLIDGVGAIVEIDVSAVGQTKQKVSYYKVNLCTNPQKPNESRVFSTPITINRNFTNFATSNIHKLLVKAPPVNGTYYATVEAFDASNVALIRPDNAGSAYLAPDAGKTIAVSSNKVAVSNLWNIAFTPSTPTNLDITANFKDFFITTVAGGSSTFFANFGPAPTGNHAIATDATVLLANPNDVAVDSSGNFYIADTANHIIRKVTTSGITTLTGIVDVAIPIGLPDPGFAGDAGLATLAQLNSPNGIDVDSAGNIYIADTNNQRIRKISTAGVITTIAGSGAFGSGTGSFTGDTGQATNATLNAPTDVKVDILGNIYIADTGNSRIRKVNTSGIITTIAGGGASSANGVDATTALLNNPLQIYVDTAYNLYITDSGNNKIRKVDNQGKINTIVGNGFPGFDGDITIIATNAQMNNPKGITADNKGNLFISDNDRVRIVTGGNISTFAGATPSGFGGDGASATLANLNGTSGLAIDSTDSIFLADTNNQRIRKIF